MYHYLTHSSDFKLKKNKTIQMHDMLNLKQYSSSLLCSKRQKHLLVISTSKLFKSFWLNLV